MQAALSHDVSHLMRIIDQWARDPVLAETLSGKDGSTTTSEVCIDYRVLSHLFSVGSINVVASDAELCASLQKSQEQAAKCALKADRHIIRADRHWCRGFYLDALDDYIEAIRLMPLNTEKDYERLATVYFRRMRVGLEAFPAELAAAVKDIELASMASTDSVKDLLKEDDVKLQDRLFQERDGRPLIEPDERESPVLHQAVQLVKPSDGSSSLVATAGEAIPAGTVLLTEKPFVRIAPSHLRLKICSGCDKELRDDRFWPCQFCTDTVYCSRMCEETNFSEHKYVCGYGNYLKSKPFFALMLKFYFRTGMGPSSPCPNKVDHIAQYVAAVRTGASVKSHALNTFRQAMDQHEHRHPTMHGDLRLYFVCMLTAIEFAQLYEACLVNGRRLEQMRLNMKESGQEQQQPSSGLEENSPQDDSSLAPAKPTWLTKAEVVACAFRDMKRFIACPLTKFVPPFDISADSNNSDENSNNYGDSRKASATHYQVKPKDEDRRLLVLSGLVFPAFIGNHCATDNSSKHHSPVSQENVMPRFSGSMQTMVASSDIAAGQQLTTRLYNTAKLY